MKDYLKEKLSDEEEKEILGIIWQTAKKHKIQMYNERKQDILSIIEIDAVTNDTYKVEEIKLPNINGNLSPFSEKEKVEIVTKLNELLNDFELFELKRTLTFNEKLVFVLIYAEKLTKRDASRLLKVRRRTIYNRCKAIEEKIKRKEKENGK